MNKKIVASVVVLLLFVGVGFNHIFSKEENINANENLATQEDNTKEEVIEEEKEDKKEEVVEKEEKEDKSEDEKNTNEEKDKDSTVSSSTSDKKEDSSNSSNSSSSSSSSNNSSNLNSSNSSSSSSSNSNTGSSSSSNNSNSSSSNTGSSSNNSSSSNSNAGSSSSNSNSSNSNTGSSSNNSNSSTKPEKPQTPSVPETPKSKTVTVSINAKTAINYGGVSHIPSSGVILGSTKIEIESGDSVFDVLVKATKKRGIHMEYSGSSSSAYIEGISNLYEFDCGSESGWMYSVNGVYPNSSIGGYKVKDGDNIKFNYTCNSGADIGAKR